MKTIVRVCVLILLSITTFLFSESSAEINDYRISTTDYLNLREGPSINSKIVIVDSAEGKEKMQLRITWTVKVLKVSEKEEIINGNKGRWVFVDTGFYNIIGRDKKITGWVFDYYLAKKSDFEPLTALSNDMTLDWEDDVAEHHYEFYKDGTFSSNGSNFKGRLYIDKRKKVLIIKYDDEKELLPLDIINKFYMKNSDICIVGFGEVNVDKHTIGDVCSKIKK